MIKKNLLLCASNLSQLDAFLESAFLENIIKKYNVNFLVNEFDEKYRDRLDKLSKYGKVFEGFNSKNVSFFYKNFLLIRQKINLFCYYSNEILKNEDRFKENFVVYRTLGVNDPGLIKIFKVLKKFKLLRVLFLLGDIFLRIFSINHLEKDNLSKNTDMVLIPYKIYDPIGFSDEIIRYCKRKKILSFGIQINWDGLVFRIPYQIPNFLGVWGEQSFVFTYSVHKVSPYRIFPIGSLLFDKYMKNNFTKEQSREALGLPKGKKIIAICLSDIIYDDIFLVKKINECLNKKIFNDDYYFYFKGYHGGKNKSLEYAFKNEYNQKRQKIDFHPNIKFWEPDDCKFEKKKYYQYFYKAADGVISNFSTMALESLINSVPTLILNYNPSEYGVNAKGYPFRLFSYHLYSLRNQEDIYYCNSRDELIDKIKNFTKISELDKKNLFSKALASVYWDNTPASEKLEKSIELIFQQNRRDQSDIGYL